MRRDPRLGLAQVTYRRDHVLDRVVDVDGLGLVCLASSTNSLRHHPSFFFFSGRMRRSSRHPAPFIPNDELEHNRIQLENNLRNSEAAIHLSSATNTDTDSYQSGDDVESLEYPRHNSGPAYNDFPSFDHRVRDYLADEDVPGHGWSYRTGDDYEEGINPYGGESLSTVAHHASAVTLGAGLTGRGTRRDMSISGAEYDPDRPLNDIIAGANSKLSVFDTPSRSKRVVSKPPYSSLFSVVHRTYP